ncbi:MAG: heme ABC transporter ATP-binding protein [Halanaerobacter sp.]
MRSKLQVEELSYKYNQLKVLEDINFSIQQGEFIGLIGPNGSGKSTLLKNINSNYQPNQGLVYLDGDNLHDLDKKDLAKNLAVVPQSTEVNFDFTVEEIVLMGRTPYIGRFSSEKEEDFAIAKEVMKLTNTFYLKDRSINQLSGGERQRVIVARSLAQNPEVLLLDEPTSNLDINYQLEMMNLLKRLNHEQELTILVVLHDLNLAAKYCDKLLLINQGQIHSFGTPQEIITSENISEVYGSDVTVKYHHPNNTPYVTLIDQQYIPQSKLEHRVHLICGGGTGRDLMEQLVEAGYQVSCGVVNKQDSDWEVATSYNIESVIEEPFAPISEAKHQQNLAKVKAAETVILTEVPIGNGNLFNLKAALWAAKSGKKVIVVNEQNIEDRDYTTGEGTELFKQLLQQEIIEVEETVSVLREVNKITKN